ncbi:MAG: hypothetical protein ACM3RP_10975 [Chitinophagales bacterium]
MTEVRPRRTLWVILVLLAVIVFGVVLWGAGNRWHRPDIIRWGRVRR